MENYHNNIKKLFESSIEKEKIINEYHENILIPQMKESQMPWVRDAINKFFDENLNIICYGSSGQATNHYLFRDKNNVIYCGYITPRIKMNNDDIFIDVFFFIIGIVNLYFIKRCIFFGSPALSLPNNIVSSFLNLKEVYNLDDLVVIKIILLFFFDSKNSSELL